MKKRSYGLIVFVLLLSVFSLPKISLAQSIYTIKTDASITGETSAGGAQKKLVRTSNGNYHTVYTYISGGFRQIFYSKSTDGGQTWTETQLTHESYDQARPSIIADSQDNLHVVWHGKSSTSTGFSQIHYLKYSNGTWSSEIDLTSGNYDQLYAAFALDGNDNIHVAWFGRFAASPVTNQVRYVRYNGTSWDSIINITSDPSLDQIRPHVEVDYNNNVHIVWYGKNSVHPNKNQIRYIKYNGTSWSSITEITDFPGDQNYTTLAIDSLNNIHVVWQYVPDPQTIDKRIYYTKYTLATNSWGPIIDLSGPGNLIGQWNPKMGIDSHDNLYVLWNGGDPGATTFQVLFTEFNGSSWSSVQNLSPNAVNNEYPSPLWFAAPIIKNVKIERPKDGYAFTFATGTSYKFYASSDLAWDVATPPVLSAGSPSGTLSSLTTSVTLAVTTDENSTCKYDTNSGTAYASMPHTFTTTGGTSHSASVQVTNNASYTYYVRCFGPYTAFNTSDYTISFSVAKPPSGHPPVMIPPIFLPPVVAQPAPETPSVAPSNTPSVALPTPLVITKNYQLKDKSEDIKLLQQWLNANGFTIAKNGAGSKGKETTLFGSLTKKALMQYQKSKGIPATGFLGPITRKSLNL